MTWTQRKVLVTGAGGFIGSHLTETLVKRGAVVRALVHYNSRRDYGQLGFMPEHEMEKVEVVMGDVRDAGCVHELVKGCDCVFHLAALIGIPYSYIAPRSYVDTNVLGTLNVLEAVKSHGSPRMVHTSTSESYGTARYTPIDERHPLQAQSPYSATKIAADKLAQSYHLSFDVPVATIRPFNTYGPRQSARAVIPTIVSQLLMGQDKVFLGSLSPERDLTFVADTVEGFLALAQCDEAVGQVTNVGSGKMISIGDLAKMAIEMINPDARIVSEAERVRPDRSEVLRLMCCHDHVRKMTGWEPRVDLREGLRQTIDFIREHLSLFRADNYTV